jgi:hypothetical protein
MRRTFIVDGSGNGSGLSSGFGEVYSGGSLHPQCGFSSVLLDHLSIEGCLLTGKLTMALSYPLPDVDLLSAITLVALPGKLTIDPGAPLLAEVPPSAP